MKCEHRPVLVELGIKKIYSIQMREEVDKTETVEMYGWTKTHEIEWQWVTVSNSPPNELLETLPELVEDIRQYVQSGKPVFVHRYVDSHDYD